MTEEIFVCPVSLEEFKDPRILPCGHTLEFSSIKGIVIPKCPLCKRVFSKKESFPVNWVVAQHLGLNISPPSKTIAEEHHAMALSIRSERAETYINNNLEKILDGIKKKSMQGECNLQFRLSMPWYESTVIKKEAKRLMLDKLTRMGFIARPCKGPCIDIGW